MMEKMLTPQEIADILKIKKTTVYEMIKRNELPSSKIGKQIRVREKDFQAYLAAAAPVPESISAPQDISQTQTASPAVLSPSAYPKNESSLLKQDYLKKMNGLVISGQNPAIDLLCAHIESEPEGLPVLRSSQNSYNSLYSLYFGKLHAACISFGEKNRNTAYLQRLIPGIPMARICLARTDFGIYTARGNPLNIQDIADLCRDNVRFINREKGSSARMMLDVALSRKSLSFASIPGYNKEMLSDLACATAVMSGRADAAVGEYCAIHQFSSLDFVHWQDADLELVFNAAYIDHPAFKIIESIVKSDYFKAELSHLPGYHTEKTGQLMVL